jgi:hypothetical protein
MGEMGPRCERGYGRPMPGLVPHQYPEEHYRSVESFALQDSPRVVRA